MRLHRAGRDGALDSPLIARFPEITYWWDPPPGTPLRPSRANAYATSGSPDGIARIDPILAARFAEPPTADMVGRVDHGGALLWCAADGLTPATACPDVLAGESGTYSWADVAGIRFGDDLVPDLGPVDTQPTCRDRAVQLAALSIAWRAAFLGERVFWVDVAARVPPVVLELASALYDGWDDRSAELCTLLGAENHTVGSDRVGHLLDDIVGAAAPGGPPRGRLTFVAEELYRFRSPCPLHDAVVGPWVFCVAPFTHDLDTLRTSIRHHLEVLADDGTHPVFLAGLGDHDAAPPDPRLAAGLLTLSWLLPGSIPMLFTGQEHGAELVVNKEFGFNTTPELREWRARLGDDVIALFNDVAMPWHELLPAHDLTETVRDVLRLRASLGTRPLDRLQPLGPPDAEEQLVGYRRTCDPGEKLDVYLNTSPTTSLHVQIPTSWQLVYATGTQGVAATPPEARLAPFATAVYASPALAARLASGRN